MNSLALLLLTLATPLAHACAGGYRGTPPKGHPGVADQAGGKRVQGSESLYPCLGTSTCRKALREYGGVFSPEGPWVPNANSSMRFLKSVANLSATLKKDLCYWSQQTLPAPPNVFGLHHINEYDAARVMNIYGELATSRLQKKMSTVKAIKFVGCAYGYSLRQAQCKFGLNTSFSCSPAVSKQKIKWPVSSVMLKITPDTIQEIADMMFTWRTTESGHWPNMHAPGNKTSGGYGWGYKGSLFAKIVPCEDLPHGIIEEFHACDEINPKSGRLYADEWWEVWENLCNIYEDPLIPSTLESCNGAEVLV
mmetsp:Transcript_90546/g.160366  ORF Transcript_90546/g.160366 Transcript_90546/m.160366 type:complete len:308 (+) Transcript_90546:2-925(+)